MNDTPDTSAESVARLVAALGTWKRGVFGDTHEESAATLTALAKERDDLRAKLASAEEAYQDQYDKACAFAESNKAKDAYLTTAQAREQRLREALPHVIEFLEEVAIAEDRSNLDGDDAETVLSQLNDGAEESLQKIRAALAGSPPVSTGGGALFNTDQRPQRGGWAPGNYGQICHTCGREFLGDKRAVTCADCAYTQSYAQPTAPSGGEGAR